MASAGHDVALEFDLPVPFAPRRFDVEADAAEWTEHLVTEGYAVIANVADVRDCALADDLAWAYLEARAANSQDVRTMGTPPVTRRAPDTWHALNGWPRESAQWGQVTHAGAGQSAFQWHCRALPKVHAAFARVWGTEALHVSFDGFNVMRPAPHPRTSQGWYHVDQSVLSECFEGVQGLICFRTMRPQDAGLVLVPQSHLDHGARAKRFQEQNDPCIEAYIPIDERPEEMRRIAGRVVKPLLHRGDLILWDSRTVHCNTPADDAAEPADACDLARLCSYVCMMPAAGTPEHVRRYRTRGVFEGVTTGHSPYFHRVVGFGAKVDGSFAVAGPAVELTDHQRRLAGLTAWTEEAQFVEGATVAGAFLAREAAARLPAWAVVAQASSDDGSAQGGNDIRGAVEADEQDEWVGGGDWDTMAACFAEESDSE
eukprot:CAMPEP_0198504300 /NCGR_PEP_ID=MMETSP1462-20131121/10422_1 /TAXON_ID=1333877 /ORGANISM="Brandtodinium nutriculum, Strain RCC3387" /LENGTH=427 /DNA_ID=CAMNT_0044233465 /DNA_START=76 /DNA_END=1359 /DNA_ORIENTATION=-